MPQHLPDETQAVYEWLMRDAVGDSEDNHFFACVIAARYIDCSANILPAALGLAREEFVSLLSRRFPSAFYSWKRSGDFRISPLSLGSTYVVDDDAIVAEEREDIRALLLEYRARGREEEGWIASILAATALRASHLWEDLGLTNRNEVSQLINRNFPQLGRLNLGSQMRWKKFFYRKLCEKTGLNLCRSPNCQSCDEYKTCFSTEQTVVDRTIGLVWKASSLG